MRNHRFSYYHVGRAPRCSAFIAASTGIFCACLAGCARPILFEHQTTEALRQSVEDATTREVREAQQHAERAEIPSGDRDAEAALDFDADRIRELEEMAGPTAYGEAPPELGGDLFGEPTRTVRIDLRQAISRAVDNNLDARIARLSPAISEAAVVAAAAAFDWAFFGDFSWGSTDQPSRVPVVNGIPVGADSRSDQSVTYSTGVRKQLTTGGSLSLSQGHTYNDNTSRGVEFFPDPAQSTFMEIDVAQPLLRGFGSDVAMAEVRLNRNAERRSVHDLKGTLLNVVTQTERAYWELAQAQQNLRIQRRLLERGIETRDVLASRRSFDVKPAEYSDAVATVERRRADVIRAENVLRQTSDALKVLINDSELTVGSEVVLLPIDRAIDEPIVMSLLDSVSAALANRPEVQSAILDIDDASIQQVVSRNARLPQLDVAFSARFQGLAEEVGDSYESISDGRFVDMLLSVVFEQPIGNRAANAGYRATQLVRMQATVGYRKTVQSVVLDVKTALRNVVTNYRLIEQTRIARLAAAENLRTLQVQEETVRSLTPDFLDLKFRRQEALAQAELDEIRALIDYNVSIANWHAAMGTALEHSGIRFVVPRAGDGMSTPRDTRPR